MAEEREAVSVFVLDFFIAFVFLCVCDVVLNTSILPFCYLMQCIVLLLGFFLSNF